MRPIGIVSALPAEARALGHSAPHGGGLRRLEEGALLAVSGIGRTRAAAAARRLVLAGSGALMSFGMAGGLDPALICGTVLLPEEIASANGSISDILLTSRDWRQRLRAAMPPSCLLGGGRLLTAGQPIARPDAKADAWQQTGAVAVDMESASIAQVAEQAGVPFIALRVIVDTAADELPAAVIAASTDGGLRVGRLIAGLLRAPADIGALIRLSARYRIATRMLATVAAAGSPARRALVGGPDGKVS